MKIEQEKLNTIQKYNYLNKKYSKPIIKKLMLASYYNKYLSREIIDKNINLENNSSISCINYKDPNFSNFISKKFIFFQ